MRRGFALGLGLAVAALFGIGLGTRTPRVDGLGAAPAPNAVEAPDPNVQASDVALEVTPTPSRVANPAVRTEATATDLVSEHDALGSERGRG